MQVDHNLEDIEQGNQMQMFEAEVVFRDGPGPIGAWGCAVRLDEQGEIPGNYLTQSSVDDMSFGRNLDGANPVEIGHY